MHVPKFHGKIDDSHELDLFQKDQGIFKVWMDSFKPGTFVSMVIKYDGVKKIRSYKANNYYWGVVIKYCCDGLGYELHEKDLVHEALKMKFLGSEQIIGLRISPSTSSLESKDFWNYIETIRTYMVSVFGIYIPDPNEIDDVNVVEDPNFKERE